MTARIIEGQSVAEEIRLQAAERAQAILRAGRPLKLLAVQVGASPSSKLYTDMQARDCQSAGISYELLCLPETTTQDELLARIASLNADSAVTGMILQMPLPSQIDARLVQAAISPRKDVEAIHPANIGRLAFGEREHAPCTAAAAMELLRRECPNLGGKDVVVVGHSEIVGKPLSLLLLQSPSAAPTLTVCHVATRDLAAHTRRAEIVIVAAGVSQAKWQGYNRRVKAGENPARPDLSPLVKADMLAEGAIVIDVATNRIPRGFDAQGLPLKDDKGKMAMMTVGDVDFEAARQKVAAITPVPGGVGPVTVAMLLRNTVRLAEQA